MGRKVVEPTKRPTCIPLGRAARGPAAPLGRIDPSIESRQWQWDCLKMDADADGVDAVDYAAKAQDGGEVVKVICLGDSAVGKSK